MTPRLTRSFAAGWTVLALVVLLGPAQAQDRLQVPRKSYLRGEIVKVTDSAEAPMRQGVSLRLRGLTVPGTWSFPLPGDGVVSLDTARYRVGDYELALVGPGTTVHATAPLYLRPAERPEVWYGNFTSRPVTAGGDPYGELRDLGMNCAYLYGVSPDDALRYGVYLVAHGNALRTFHLKMTPEQKKPLMQVFRSAAGVDKPREVPCMRNPEVIRLAGDRAVEEMKDLIAYPGVMGIGVDDEVGMFAYDWNETGGVTCYCESCRKQWKARTGQEPPRPKLLPPGSIVPDNDPYLRYALQWTGSGDYYGPAEEQYNLALAGKLHTAYPGLTVFQTPGALYGEMDTIHWEIYTYWMSSPVATALTDMSFVRANAQVENYGQKPIWPLIGWFQRLPAPEWTGAFIAEQSRMCLAEGAKGIWLTLMPWYSSGGRHGPALLTGMEHVAPAIRATGRLLEQFGPALIRVQPSRYPVAVLFSEDTQLFQRSLDPKLIAAAKARGSWSEVPWEHREAVDMGFAALLRAGAAAEIISEDDVLAGKLKHYQALVLLDHKYARQGLVDRLKEYAAAGGVVLADQGTLIKPEQAKALPFDSSQFPSAVNLGLRAARTAGERLEIVFDRTTGIEREWALLAQPVLRQELPAAAQVVTSDNRQLIARTGASGDTDYLYVLNADVKGEQRGLVSAKTRGRYAYDLCAGDTAAYAVLEGTLKVNAIVPAGDWRVYAITPAPVEAVTVSAASAAGEVRVQVAVAGAGGQVISGAFPLQMTVTDPRGTVLPYGGYFGTEAGKLAHAFRPAVNDPAGVWKITVTNLMTGHTAETEVKVEAVK